MKARSLALVFLVWTGCIDILDLAEGIPLPTECKTDDDCGAQHSCERSTCRSLRCGAEGAQQCNGLQVERCGSAGLWEAQLPQCDAACSDGVCVPPRSCSEYPVCAEDVSCCKTLEVPEQTYRLSYAFQSTSGDSEHEVTQGVERYVRRFALDRFEVSVSRFLEFTVDYDADGRPEAHDGAHPAFPDSGWEEAWSDDPAKLPREQISLENVLHRNGQARNPPDDRVPVRGVNWYIAFAFCIWDGGRLPTEAEWAAAAFGGSDERQYPWITDLGVPITMQRAQFSEGELAAEGPAPVGSHPEGRGAFLHDDLAGNVEEWVADVHEPRLEASCSAGEGALAREHECFQREGGRERVLRGGSFADRGEALRNVARKGALAATARETAGFRCARDIAP